MITAEGRTRPSTVLIKHQGGNSPALFQSKDLETMTTSPTSQSALKSGAAKDDALGADGHFTFSIADLLANDPGGTAKANVATQFFFGDAATDQTHQADYLTAHGITDNHNGTFTIGEGATDFSYFVQIGNKGTWSQADVSVTAPVPPPAPHAGAELFAENFEGLTTEPQFGLGDLSTHGWINASQSEICKSGYNAIASTSGDYWLDTQNSPGGISISHAFIDPTGGQAQLSFDIATPSGIRNPITDATDKDGLLQFKIDGSVVAQITTAQVQAAAGGADKMAHFDFVFDTGAAGSHTLEIVDATIHVGVAGFAVDSLMIHDWVV